MNKINILIVIIWTSFAQTALGYLAVLPAQLATDSQGHMKEVQYRLPCGAQYLGAILTLHKRSKKLSKLAMAGQPNLGINPKFSHAVGVGALVTMSRKPCSRIPQFKVSHLGYFQMRSSSYAQPFVQKKRNVDLKLATLESLDLVRLGRKNYLQASFLSSSCRIQPSSIVLSHNDKGLVHVGVLEIINKKSKNCKLKNRAIRYAISSSMVKKIKKIRSMRHKALMIKDYSQTASIPQFGLSLSRLTHMKSSRTQGFFADYQRRCDQAPVGLLVSKGGANSRTSEHRSMVLARFKNHTCDTSKIVKDRYIIPQVHLPSVNTEISIQAHSKRISALNQVKLLVVKPRKIGSVKERNTKRRLTEVRYLKNCDKDLGILLSLDAGQKLSLGVLKQRQEGLCKSAPKVNALRHHLSLTKQQVKAYPLVLKGQVI